MLAILSHCIVFPATYYVSSSGSDSNTGTSQASPWKTISKVNTVSLSPGDQVLFQRGGAFRGNLLINQSGTSASPITVSAYGTGALPVFLGSQLVTGWTLHQGNIWKVQLSSAQIVQHVFSNDSLMTLARYPNTGWLRNVSGSNSSITDPSLVQPANYWNGSTIVVRSHIWNYDTTKVFSYSPGNLTFRPLSYNLSSYEWGYFIRDKFEELDAPGEWFFNQSTSTLYYYPISGNPANEIIEAVTTNLSTNACGIRTAWQKTDIIVENLEFRKYGYAAISTSGANNIMIRNCRFDQCDLAVRLYGNNQTVINSTIARCYKMAIQSLSGGGIAGYGNYNTIENNIVTDCAIYPGLGKNWGYFGIGSSGFFNVIRGNKLKRIGYIAITCDNNAVVERNVVEDACFILNDGAGISFDNTDGAIIRDNIVLRTVGSYQGSCAPDYHGCVPKGVGIYFGNISNKNVIVNGNTIAHCGGSGIWFDHTMLSQGNQITNNVVFDNTLYQLGISDYSNYNSPGATPPFALASYPNQLVVGNTFYCGDSAQRSMYHINKWYYGIDFADFNQNKYVNPWDTVDIKIDDYTAGNHSNHSLSSWRAIRGDDMQSTNTPYMPTSETSDHILVYNDTTVSKTVSLPVGLWRDLDNNIYQTSITLDPFRSKVLYLEPPDNPAATPSTNVSLLVQATASSNSITLSWSSYGSATGYTIFRKLKSATTWGTAIATLSSSSTQYVDNSVTQNTYYEYKISRASSLGTAHGYVSSAIQLAPVEYRGKMILVVDNTFTTSLATQLTQLQTDLKVDGWNVTRIDVSRTGSPATIRSQIQTIYNADPTNVKSVLLFGHVPVYRSGNISPDGHNAIQWASDTYYGEMTSTWSASQTSLPSDVELEVGRIDMFNLPAFGVSEQQLLTNYLTKLHQFKIKQFTPQVRMLMQDNLNLQSVPYPLAEISYRTAGPLVGISNLTDIPTYNNPNFVSRMPEGWLWGFFSGGGTYIGAGGIGNTFNFVNSQNNCIFNICFGSYFGNWDCNNASVPEWNNNTNNLMRATIANGQALTCVYGGQPNWFFHHMGMGDPIGYSTKMSMNNRTAAAIYQPQNGGWGGQGFTTVHLGLMGDPSIRMNYVSPPTNLVAVDNGATITFTWTASSQAVDGYYLYQIINGVPVRAYPTLITSTSVTGNFVDVAGTEYMVRAAKLESNFSGSYNNLSLGTMTTISASPSCLLNLKVFLQGPYNGTNMYDSLRYDNLIPLTEPYPSIGYVHVNSATQTTTSGVLSTTGNSAVVDWVVVELRSSSSPSTRLYTKAGLVRRDGTIVNSNGTSPFSISAPIGSYHVSVLHRNHLGIMTQSPLALSGTQTNLDFTVSSTPTWGTAARVQSGSSMLMWSGNVNFDGELKYTGSNNDRDPILVAIGGTVPTDIVTGYMMEDVNMDGVVKYTGSNNDRDPILVNIGGTIPTNILIQQLP